MGNTNNTDKIKKIVSIGIVTVGCFIGGVLVSSFNSNKKQNNNIDNRDAYTSTNAKNAAGEIENEYHNENEQYDTSSPQNIKNIDSIALKKYTVEKIIIEQISDKITTEKESKTYEFNSTESGTYRFELSNVPQNIWFYFKLFNSSMEQLVSGSGDNGDGITYELDSNTKYFFVVEQGWNTGSYTLNIGSQKPIIDVSEYTSIDDAIQFTNQKNLYEFTSTEAGTYRFELSNVPQNIWFYFKLFNSSMEQLNSASGDNGDGIGYF